MCQSKYTLRKSYCPSLHCPVRYYTVQNDNNRDIRNNNKQWQFISSHLISSHPLFIQANTNEEKLCQMKDCNEWYAQRSDHLIDWRRREKDCKRERGKERKRESMGVFSSIFIELFNSMRVTYYLSSGVSISFLPHIIIIIHPTVCL